ncbi:MAG: Eco57I restriction-modification methylase domain-containing protein, partial [Bacteroidales bacterium]|nr:Eco57I restriction-modification methylase domain-containing protein [Bacteroidales bacterium]
LRNFVISHLDSFEKDYALVAFYSNSDGGADWRFSFVKLEYTTEVKEGKIKQNKDLTPAKRYSFLVGEHEKAHTAKKQLLPLLENIYNNPTVEEIELAFSIEAVTNEFFEQYKTLFVGLTEQFEQNNQLKTELAAAGIEIPRFTKKLLGQIVFLYFLQKKGWMGVAKDQEWGTGDKRFLQTLFDQSASEGKNFFGDYLQFLFYEALAHKHNDEGVHGFYAPLNSKVPFLNGGLFEADYDWENDHIAIPNELFRNKDKIGKSGDIGSGVLDVFDRYNFTIKEDEPLEKEVAVDPEMLGKVFENMLEVTERKSKGAFYTPREIVHYMCQESLIHYLDNAVNSTGIVNILIPKEDIETFIRRGFFTLENDQRVLRVGKETTAYSFKLPETVRTNADLLDQKLAEVRICDPAIGSGAFPVGMLHEIVNARLVLKPHLINPGNPVNPENPDSDYAYQLKRHTIQECIYGVDIDASAIDIARLRLWLSLVVNEEDLDTIEALPNLDYKIVCGNSLIGIPQGVTYNIDIEKELGILKDQFFTETDETTKKELRTFINSKIQEQFVFIEPIIGYKIDFDFKLFFSEVWREKGGFDIVIGNPPYVRVQNIPHTLIDLYKRLFKFAFKRIDISILFIERALNLINNQGHFTYISSNQFLSTDYGQKAREYLSKKKIFEKIIDFGSLPVFKSAMTYVSIFIGTRIENEKIEYKEIKNLPFEIPINFLYLDTSTLSDDIWIFGNQEELLIQKTINTGIINLKKVAKAWAGVFTGNDKLLMFEKDNLPDFIEHELLMPVIRAQNCNRFSYSSPGHYIFYPYKEVNGKTVLIDLNEMRIKYPKSFDFIMKNEFDLKNRKDSRKLMAEKIGWYGLIRFGTLAKFKELKIVSPGEVKHNKFTLDNSQAAFSCGRVFSINLKTELIDNFTLLALLNSTIVEYYLHQNASLKAGGYYSYSSSVLDSIPLKIPEKSFIFHNLTKYLLFINSILNNRLIAKYFDDIIDSCVFELYFPNEIKSANKEILRYLVDLKPITDDMSNEQKLAIIQSEFERLYDPNHPVRNNVETLDSVEEVRIIREALK